MIPSDAFAQLGVAGMIVAVVIGVLALILQGKLRAEREVEREEKAVERRDEIIDSMTVALDRNTTALNSNTDTLRRNTDHLEQVARGIEALRSIGERRHP